MSASKKSDSFSAHSIAAALLAAEKKVNKPLDWQPKNEDQRMYLDNFHSLCMRDAEAVPEITGRADLDISEINKEVQGMEPVAHLDESRSDSPLVVPMGVVGKLDVLVKWVDAGSPEAIQWTRNRDKFQFPAVKMGSGGLSIVNSSKHPDPIAMLKTKGDYQIVLTKAHEAPLYGLPLLYFMTGLLLETEPNWAYCGVRFPMVDLKDHPNINWIVGMSAHCGSTEMMPMQDTAIRIQQALQDNVLRMDEVGARVVSVTRMRMGLIGARAEPSPPPPLVIDEPFYLALIRPGSDIPFFVAYVVEENWNKPKSLTDLSL